MCWPPAGVRLEVICGLAPETKRPRALIRPRPQRPPTARRRVVLRYKGGPVAASRAAGSTESIRGCPGELHHPWPTPAAGQPAPPHSGVSTQDGAIGPRIRRRQDTPLAWLGAIVRPSPVVPAVRRSRQLAAARPSGMVMAPRQDQPPAIATAGRPTHRLRAGAPTRLGHKRSREPAAVRRQ